MLKTLTFYGEFIRDYWHNIYSRDSVWALRPPNYLRQLPGESRLGLFTFLTN